MYSEYSNTLIKFIPRDPKVAITKPKDIIAPIMYDIMIVLLYLLGTVILSFGITNMIKSGK